MEGKIVQFGILRSGSTLCCLLLRDLFGRYNVYKSHIFKENHLELKHIITHRDFRDSTLSQFRVFQSRIDKKQGFDFVDKDIVTKSPNKINYYEFLSNEMKEIHIINCSNNILKGIMEMEKVMANTEHIIMRYDKCYNNIPYMLNEFEKFFDIKIDNKEKFTEKYSLESVKKISDNLGGFDTVDRYTQIHGSHIYNGDTGQWKYLPEKYQNILNEKFGPYLEKYGYTI